MEVTAQLPHRFPFLMVDRVLERLPGVRVRARKLVSQTEPFLQGHLPGRPVVPGVLLLEMLAQTGAFLEAEPLGDAPIFLAQVVDARFRRPALPGDALDLEVVPEAAFGGLHRIQGTIRCGNEVICTARLVLKKGAPLEVAP